MSLHNISMLSIEIVIAIAIYPQKSGRQFKEVPNRMILF